MKFKPFDEDQARKDIAALKAEIAELETRLAEAHLTLRDQYAGQAMQAEAVRLPEGSPEMIAEQAFRLANAMMDRRGKKRE